MKKYKLKNIVLCLIFVFASILGLVLGIERYPSLWPAFPHFEVFWKVYLDHFMAGFLIPLWIFVIYAGINLLFEGSSSLKNQKIIMFTGFIVGMLIALLWDFLIPLTYMIRVMIYNNYSFLIFVETLKLWYWTPRFEFVQFLFDWAGIFVAILFIKSFRKDLR